MAGNSDKKFDKPLDYIQQNVKNILGDIEFYSDEKRNLIRASSHSIIPLVRLILFPDDNREELNFTCDSAVASGFDKKSKFFQIFYNEIHRLYVSDSHIKPNNAKWEINDIAYDSFFECLIDQILRSFNPNHQVRIRHLTKSEQREISKIITDKDLCKILFKLNFHWSKYRKNNFTKVVDLSIDLCIKDRKSLRVPIEKIFEILKKNKKALSPYLKELEEFLPEKNVNFETGYRAIERFVLSVNFVHKFLFQEIAKNKTITAFVECENGNLEKVTRVRNYLFGAKNCDLIFPNKSSFFDISKYHDEYISLKACDVTIDDSVVKESNLFLDREEFLTELFRNITSDNEKVAESIEIIKSNNLGTISSLFLTSWIKKGEIRRLSEGSRTAIGKKIFEACDEIKKKQNKFSSKDVFNYIKNNIWPNQERNSGIILDMNEKNCTLNWRVDHSAKSKPMTKTRFQRIVSEYRNKSE